MNGVEVICKAQLRAAKLLTFAGSLGGGRAAGVHLQLQALLAALVHCADLLLFVLIPPAVLPACG